MMDKETKEAVVGFILYTTAMAAAMWIILSSIMVLISQWIGRWFICV